MSDVERSVKRAPVPNDGGVGEEAEAERALGRLAALGIPLIAIAAAIGVGLVVPSVNSGRLTISVGPALVAMACGTLFGAIALLWASLRTLTGDAPVPGEGHRGSPAHLDALSDEKRRLLRALKDLEAEHAIGKIDEADYLAIATRYREEAKSLLRRMDADLAPARAEAERLARDYLAAHAAGVSPPRVAKPASAARSKSARVMCSGCGTSNEPDASFCKGCGGSMERTQERDDVAT